MPNNALVDTQIWLAVLRRIANFYATNSTGLGNTLAQHKCLPNKVLAAIIKHRLTG